MDEALNKSQIYTFFCSSSTQNVGRYWLLTDREDKRSSFEKPCLMPGNILNGGSKLSNMVHPQSGDPSNGWLLNHIGRIVFASIMCLDNRCLNFLPDKIVKSHQVQQLEVTESLSPSPPVLLIMR